MMLPARKKETSKVSIPLELRMGINVHFQLCLEGADGAGCVKVECAGEHDEVVFALVG